MPQRPARLHALNARAQVWNPGFDVTPARLIAGIITERGLVPKSKASFQVRVATASGGFSCSVES